MLQVTVSQRKAYLQGTRASQDRKDPWPLPWLMHGGTGVGVEILQAVNDGVKE